MGTAFFVCDGSGIADEDNIGQDLSNIHAKLLRIDIGEPGGGLIVAPSAFGSVNRELIIALAAKYSLPAIYYERPFTDLGGLIAYSPDYFGGFEPAAGYVDRILKGAKPGDLPVQAPTKFELSINLKTATALGLTVPPAILAIADKVIE